MYRVFGQTMTENELTVFSPDFKKLHCYKKIEPVYNMQTNELIFVENELEPTKGNGDGPKIVDFNRNLPHVLFSAENVTEEKIEKIKKSAKPMHIYIDGELFFSGHAVVSSLLGYKVLKLITPGFNTSGCVTFQFSNGFRSKIFVFGYEEMKLNSCFEKLNW